MLLRQPFQISMSMLIRMCCSLILLLFPANGFYFILIKHASTFRTSLHHKKDDRYFWRIAYPARRMEKWFGGGGGDGMTIATNKKTNSAVKWVSLLCRLIVTQNAPSITFGHALTVVHRRQIDIFGCNCNMHTMLSMKNDRLIYARWLVKKYESNGKNGHRNGCEKKRERETLDRGTRSTRMPEPAPVSSISILHNTKRERNT